MLWLAQKMALAAFAGQLHIIALGNCICSGSAIPYKQHFVPLAVTKAFFRFIILQGKRLASNPLRKSLMQECCAVFSSATLLLSKNSHVHAGKNGLCIRKAQMPDSQ
jgi:hypothetical protein